MNQTYNLLAVVILGLFLELIMAYKLRSDKKRLEKMDEEYKNEFKRMKETLDKVISSTRNESQEIILQTLDQYHDVQGEVKNFTLKLHQRVDDVTQEIVEQQKDILQKHAKHSSQELVESVSTEIKSLSKTLQETLLNIQKQVSEELMKEAQAAKKEIQDFKNLQKEKIAKESENLVNNVAKKYLGKNITSSDKHDLTLKLIDEVWQENN